MLFVNNNIPGTIVVKGEGSVLVSGLENFIKPGLPESIFPNVLVALYLGYDVDLNANNNILNTDINTLDDGTPDVDLGT